MKSKYTILILFILSFISCERDKKDYLEEFQIHKEEFNYLKNYIQKNYIQNDSCKQKPRLIFINCKEVKKSLFYEQICDDSISAKMKQLNIADINVENDYKCTIDNKFNEIYFRINTVTYSPTYYYYYQYCKDTLDFKSKTIENIYIEGNWSIYIDSN